MIKHQGKWTLLFLLTLVESIGACIWLISIPGERASAVLFGLSAVRLMLLVIPILLASGSIFMIVSIQKSTFGLRRAVGVLDKWSESQKVTAIFQLTMLLAVVFVLNIGNIIALTAQESARLQPIKLMLILVLLQSCLPFQWAGFRAANGSTASRLNLRVFFWVVLVGVIFAYAGVFFGIDAALHSPFISTSGVPILPGQLLIAILVGGMLSLIPENPVRFRWRLDWFILPALFLLACVLWLQVPIPENHFNRSSNISPNGPFPYSDSRVYDSNSESFLLGNTLANGNSLHRPLYSLFLAVLHLVLGQNYPDIINAQTIIFAVFPVLVYWFTRTLFSRPAALTAALLVIFREQNIAVMSAQYTQSSVRMLMTETITGLFLVGLVLILLHLAKNSDSKSLALLSGAWIGLTALIRTQVLFLAVIAIIVVAVKNWRNLKGALIMTAYILGGVLLVASAWMGRNYLRSGEFVFENPRYATKTLVEAATGKYTGRGTEEPGAGESQVFSAILTDPGNFILKTGSHFTNSLLSSLYQLPWDVNVFTDLPGYVRIGPDQLFFPYENLTPGQVVAIIAHLLIILIGITAAWSKVKMGAFIPVLVYLAYNLTSSAVGFSGWRFIQPVDWVFLIYSAVGLHWLLFKPNPYALIGSPAGLPAPQPRLSLAGSLGLALAFSLAMPVSEALIPDYFEPTTQQSLSAETLVALRGSQAEAQSGQIARLLQDPAVVVVQGKLLYPQYLTANNYFNKVNKVVEDNRAVEEALPVLAFELLGETKLNVFVKMDAIPGSVPHWSDGIVVGCLKGEFLEGYMIKLGRQEDEVLISRYGIPDKCPAR